MKALRLMLVAVTLGLAGMSSANAHDNVGFSISIGSPGYYGPPPVYFGPPPVYHYYTPRVYYHYDRPYYFGGYRGHYYRGEGPHGFRGHGGPAYGHGRGHR